MMLRQFLLMKQQEQLPDHLSVRDMKTWLLTGRSFLEEFQEIIQRTGIEHLFTTELAWTTARLFCLSQMEEELLEDLDKERCVTLEGLLMFVSVVHTKAEKDAQTYLSALQSKLLQIFGGIQIASGPLSAREAKPAELLELEQSAAALVPEVVDTALKFLLVEPERENMSEAASAEIGKLLTNSAFPCLFRFGRVSETLLLCVCTKEAQSMVEAIYNRFDKCSKSFKLMDYDESYYNAREGIISAIQDMDHEVQTDASSQAHFQLEEGLVEEREASPWVALDKEVDFMPKDVTEDTYRKEDSVVQNMDNDEKMDASSKAHLQLEEGLLEKRETSLDLSPLEELEERLVDEREASPRVALDEEVDTFSNDVTEDTYRKEETLVQDSAVEDMDHKVQFGATSQANFWRRDFWRRERLLLRSFSQRNWKRDSWTRGRLRHESLEVIATTVSLADGDTSSVKLETNGAVHLDDELEVLQQEEVIVYETHDVLVQDCDDKKKGLRAFFCSFRKMTCCFRVSIKQ